ncbi:MoaD/ThiS family protein [bacterium]|nr:MoaD/ThiS family protein [bacterium]
MEAPGGTVAEVVAALEAARPGLRDFILDEHGKLRKHVNIFVGQKMVGDRDGLSDTLAPDAKLFVMQALSGG